MSMIATTYPLPLESQRTSTTATPTRAWGFWVTLGWFGAAAITYVAVSFLCGIGYVFWSVLSRPDVAIDLEAPAIGYLASALSMPAAALLLMLAARRRSSVRDYIGFAMPAWRHVVIGLGVLAAYGCASAAFFYLFPAYDQIPEIIREYRAIVGNPTAIALFWLSAVVTAPVAEEIVFRGFLMRGLGASRLGGMGAIMLSSLVFAAVHVQYNLPTMTMVLGIGLILGVMRWRSASTTLTIMLHAAWNLAATLFIVWQA